MKKNKTLEIFLSQTIKATAFIFGMWHYQVDLYQNTSNYGPMLWGLGIHITDKQGNL